ncbi:MAG: DNA primase [Lachnospiraceae bacterium]|nr:DNA primase [Lachnospiraceae bacterium]
MYYSEDLVEEIRSRNDIVDIINSYVSLKKKGNTYTACCPFHNEKTPSFHVSREKQLYHCFGCGAAGTVYTFLQQYENYTFPESVEFLANRAGIQLPQREMTLQERKEADYNSALKEINKAAAGYFYYALRQKNGEAAMKYLTDRGLSQETIHKFGLGYSNMYRDDLYQYLKQKGYDDKLLIDSGLVRFDERQGVNDVFWNRVMFPIMDLNGKVIGFGGRVLGDGLPKYVNSQETKIYEKRRHLYGFHIARRSRREGFILCEGYMDVISMHQAGFDNACASLGTAFTIQQAMLLKRYTDKVYLAYDSDGAGVSAAQKAIPILREVGISARVINMQPYKDPDEFIKALGAEAFEERIQQAESSIMFQVRVAAGKFNQQDPESRTEFQQEIAKIVAVLQEPLERDNYIEAIANQYFMDKKKLTDLVNRYGKYITEQKQYMEAAQEEKPQDIRRQERLEQRKQQPQRLLLTWLVNYPKELFPQIRGRIGPEDFIDEFCQLLAKQLFEQYENSGDVQPAKIINQFEDVEEQTKVASVLQTTLKLEPSPEDNSVVITEIVRKVKEESIQYQLAHLQDYSRLQEIIKQKSEIPTWNISLTCG